MNKENIIHLSIYDKRRFAQEKNCCTSTVDKAIKELKNNYILEKVGSSTFRINIFCFWRSNKEIRELRIKEVVKEIEQGEREPKTLGVKAYEKQDVRYN